MTQDDRPSLSVASYLRAEEQVVPFRPRPELDELLSWCGSGEHIGVRLVTGDGGAGKTRLALRLCSELKLNGWKALWVHRGMEMVAAGAPRKLEEPYVLVVDYAEARDNLAAMLSDIAVDAVGPDVRVVLLARGSGEWWQRLVSGSAERVARLLAMPPLLLGPIAVEGGPDALFAEALTVFADKLKVVRPDVRLGLTDPDSLVLVIHAAALLAVLDHSRGSGGDTPRSAAEVLDGLLDHEGRYWVQSAAARGLDLDVAVQRLAVAVGCLIGADSEAAAADLMRRVPDLADSGERRGRVARWLHDLYPEILPSDAGTREWIGPLRPDLVAERLILTELNRRPELIPGLFTALNSDQAVHALTVLARAEVRAPSEPSLIRTALAADLERLAVPTMSVAITIHLVLGDLLAEALPRQPVSVGTLEQLASMTPYPSIVLAPVAAIVLRLLADQSTDIGKRAGWLLDLGRRLADLGRPEEALTVLEETVSINRRQVETNMELFRPVLAQALNDQSQCFGRLKRWNEALPVIEEAVTIRCDLAQDNSDAFLRDYAQSLNNQSFCLNELGRPEQALIPNEKAISIRRGLIRDRLREMADVDEERGRRDLMQIRPELFYALAAALSNRSVSLTALGDHEEALVAAVEATRTFRELTERFPDGYLSVLASSLNNESRSLANQGRRKEALTAVDEATRIFRVLALVRPRAFLPALADSLHNQSLCLMEAGCTAEAVAARSEIARIHYILAQGI